MCPFNQNQLQKSLMHILIFVLVKTGLSQYISKGKVCGTLYSGRNLVGESFTLTDFDMSGNLKRDFRSSVSGWNGTGSIRVETNCTMTVYNETYFRSNSLTFGPGDHTDLLINPSSTKCVCTRECRCTNINLPKLEYGRAYVSGNCNTCNASYISLENNGEIIDFSPSYEKKVNSILLRGGCNLTIYPHYSPNPTRVLSTKVIEEFHGAIQSYKIDCDDSAYMPPIRPKTYPEEIELPKTEDLIFDLLATNATLINHPGIQAILKSMEHGRSARNGYILLLGEYFADHIGFEKCRPIMPGIRECHIAIRLDELGITAQLRVIYAGLMYSPYNWQRDILVAASLDSYLENQEDLQSKIPNAVIISCPGENVYELRAANVLLVRRQLLDKTHSNVIFLVNNVSDYYPEWQIYRFEDMVNTEFTFPKPTIVIANTRFHSAKAKVKVNGYRNMTSGEYWPKNIQDALMLVAEKGNDPLGYAIFKEAFKDGNRQNVVTEISAELLTGDEDILELYYALCYYAVTAKTTFLGGMAVLKTQVAQKLTQAAGKTASSKPNEVATEATVPEVTSSPDISSQLPCERHQWRAVANLTKGDKFKTLDFGLVDLRGHRMFPCRAEVNTRGVLRVGSFTFEEGACRVWYKVGVVTQVVNAEVLIIPACDLQVVTDSHGNSFRYQYSFIRQQNVTETDSVTAVFAGDSKPRNANKYIAFGSYSVKTDCGLRAVDMIGTACLYNCVPDNQNKSAIFAGVTKAFETSNFKVLVCTRTKA